MPPHLDEEQVERLRVIAAKCPVHRTLEGEVAFDERVELRLSARRATLRDDLLAPEEALAMDVHGGKDAAVLVPLFEDAAASCTPSSRAAATTCAATPARSRSPAGAGTPARTLLETALREAHEEIGLPPEAVEVVGALQPTPTFVTNYAIYPFVGADRARVRLGAAAHRGRRGARAAAARPARPATASGG